MLFFSAITISAGASPGFNPPATPEKNHLLRIKFFSSNKVIVIAAFTFPTPDFTKTTDFSSEFFR
ncbi:hypothetical protein ACFFJX_17385 [Pseudarcicella hirudinis]|uniref:hypothetical protein n=1 Tax=Pseudarcicella hirudinis TaxID=1079859 RepID=UPI0035EF09D1